METKSFYFSYVIISLLLFFNTYVIFNEILENTFGGVSIADILIAIHTKSRRQRSEDKKMESLGSLIQKEKLLHILCCDLL